MSTFSLEAEFVHDPLGLESPWGLPILRILVFFREHDFTRISLRRRAERTAYTMQLRRTYSVGCKTTEEVVRNLNDSRIERKV